MPRIHTIKPAFLHDEALDDLGDTARIVYLGLWLYADREGRLEDRPRFLSLQVLPYRPHLFQPALEALLAGGWVCRYGFNGKSYLYLPNFTRHQRPHHTEPASTLPSPHGETTVGPPLDHGEAPEGREGKGVQEGKGVPYNARAREEPQEPERAVREDPIPQVWSLWRQRFRETVGAEERLHVSPAQWPRLRSIAAAAPLEDLDAAMQLFFAAPKWQSSRHLAMFDENLGQLLGWHRTHPGLPFGAQVPAKGSGAPPPDAFTATREDWTCPHEPHCGSYWGCQKRIELEQAKEASRATTVTRSLRASCAACGGAGSGVGCDTS